METLQAIYIALAVFGVGVTIVDLFGALDGYTAAPPAAAGVVMALSKIGAVFALTHLVMGGGAKTDGGAKSGGGDDDDELMRQMMGGGAADAGAKKEEKKLDDDDELLKKMMGTP